MKIIEYFKSYNEEVLVPYKKWSAKHKFGFYVVGPLVFIGLTYALCEILIHSNSKHK